jgi:hypothetical protein
LLVVRMGPGLGRLVLPPVDAIVCLLATSSAARAGEIQRKTSSPNSARCLALTIRAGIRVLACVSML